MSRRRLQASDSLELLLDTLCNTFGGVLFIAILVVVLLQMSGNGAASKPREPINSQNLLDLADELDVLGRERESLLRDFRVIPVDPSRSEISASRRHAVLAESKARLEEIERQKDAALVKVGRTDASVLELDEEIVEIKDRPKQLDREIEEIRQQINELRRRNSRTIYTPLAHSTEKRSVALELRYGRIYLVHDYDASERPMGPNRKEYGVLADSNGELEVTADPTCGLPIGDGSSLADHLGSQLARFNPDNWYLDIAVRSGSFASYHTFQKAAHELGYEMRILLIPEDGSFVDRGGKQSDVQ